MRNEEVITELFRRTRLTVDADDPVLIILALAEIILENQSDVTAERVSLIANGFERSAEKTSNSIVEVLNKSAGILQGLLSQIEAAKVNLSLPEYLEVKHPKTKEETQVDSFKERFTKVAIVCGIFSLGACFAFFVSGFMFVFFR